MLRLTAGKVVFKTIPENHRKVCEKVKKVPRRKYYYDAFWGKKRARWGDMMCSEYLCVLDAFVFPLSHDDSLPSLRAFSKNPSTPMRAILAAKN